MLFEISFPVTAIDLLSAAAYVCKGVFGGLIALAVKYYGDILIMRYKSKKGGQQQ